MYWDLFSLLFLYVAQAMGGGKRPTRVGYVCLFYDSALYFWLNEVLGLAVVVEDRGTVCLKYSRIENSFQATFLTLYSAFTRGWCKVIVWY